MNDTVVIPLARPADNASRATRIPPRIAIRAARNAIMINVRSFLHNAAILIAHRVTVSMIFAAIAAAPAPNVTAPSSAPIPISIAISTAICAMNQPISSHALSTASIMPRANPAIESAESATLPNEDPNER
ncbi:hypothetical protein [Agromyces salentinus]|uniref:hypothetical protein n=1 Tax=Agromyces salentinus TaxID=269421 RepID=UPI0012FA743C|nr:hypothetical protein [Agromyces salentinus]